MWNAGQAEGKDQIKVKSFPVFTLTQSKHVQQALKVWSEGHSFYTSLENCE